MKRNSIFIAVVALLAASAANADHNVLLDEVAVTDGRDGQLKPASPATTVTIDSKQIQDTVNAVDTPDILKYVPSLMVRKRDSADYGGATLATRIWGVSYSAKSIVNVDGMPISNQLYNDNNYGPPKWFMVSPEEIKKVDVMYGPFSAAHSGNSMGAVVNIATQMPEKFTAVTSVTGSLQDFNKFGTSDHYLSGQASALIGDKADKLSWRLSVNHEDANTQPRAFVTGLLASGSSSGYLTTYPYTKKDGTAGNGYDGASTLLHGVSDSVNLRLAYDLTSSLKLGINSGIWNGDTNSHTQSYLPGGTYQTYSKSNTTTSFTSNYYACSDAGTTTSGVDVIAPACTGFASGIYSLAQTHFMNGLILTSDDHGKFNWQATVTNFYYDKNIQRTAGATTTDGTARNDYAGTIADYGGSGWTTADWVGNYKLVEGIGAQTISFGLHYDYNRLNNNNYTTVNWATADTGTVTTVGKGVTETKALWAQDAWSLSQDLRLTTGLRYESWSTFNGYLYSSSATSVSGNQPNASYEHLSPKLSLAYDASKNWLITGSLANAMRFPTTGELYNVVSSTTPYTSGTTGTSYLVPNPSGIKPENVWSAELSVENHGHDGFIRTALFAEQVNDALISQYGYLTGTITTSPFLFSYWQNVKKVRSYGLEVSGLSKDLVIKRFDFGGSVTLVRSTIVESDGLGSSHQSIVGNATPGVSPLRITSVATYRPDDKLTLSLAARYQRQFASSIDNNDVNANTYLGFSGFFIVDVKARYQIDKHWSSSFGVDNLNNRDYFLYHPFPQRTFVANLKYNY